MVKCYPIKILSIRQWPYFRTDGQIHDGRATSRTGGRPLFSATRDKGLSTTMIGRDDKN
ncbi:MAG: hypothetical protein WAK17_15550 [Candidatus Nitrosopolaris sp.]